jgi:hypothetical protein
LPPNTITKNWPVSTDTNKKSSWIRRTIDQDVVIKGKQTLTTSLFTNIKRTTRSPWISNNRSRCGNQRETVTGD